MVQDKKVRDITRGLINRNLEKLVKTKEEWKLLDNSLKEHF